MGNNIVLPYSGRIPGGIHVGTDVVISGRVLPQCSRFSVNLCVGPTYDQDCALHFNPRVNENKVVRNHLQGGSWGTEETAGGCPFKKGFVFNIHMKVQHHGYQVTVNHKHFCDFNHRLPKESVQFIYIEGDVIITNIEFRGQGGGHHHHGYPAPPSFPGVPGMPGVPGVPGVPGYPPAPAVCPPGRMHYPPAPVPGYPGGAGGPIYNPPVPFTTPIPGGLYIGKIIYITGVPHPNPSRFTVNLQCGPYDSGDFAMHFDVRFNYGNSHNQVVRTHKQGGNYGGEETGASYFPFYPNSNFEMMILCDQAGFKVAVNNQHFVEFYHRLPFNCADHINVVGDVRLTQVRFQ